MQYAEYQRRVLARASHRWHNEKLDVEDFREVLCEFIKWGNALDSIKKALMYGKDFKHPDGNVEVEIAMPIPSERDQRLIHAMLGVATEGVEMMEAVSKFFNGEPFDEVNLQEEFGDTEWYRAFGLSELNQTHEENIEQNDAKLEKRFGSIFSEDRAINRDLDAERKTLEG